MARTSPKDAKIKQEDMSSSSPNTGGGRKRKRSQSSDAKQGKQKAARTTTHKSSAKNLIKGDVTTREFINGVLNLGLDNKHFRQDGKRKAKRLTRQIEMTLESVEILYDRYKEFRNGTVGPLVPCTELDLLDYAIRKIAQEDDVEARACHGIKSTPMQDYQRKLVEKARKDFKLDEPEFEADEDYGIDIVEELESSARRLDAAALAKCLEKCKGTVRRLRDALIAELPNHPYFVGSSRDLQAQIVKLIIALSNDKIRMRAMYINGIDEGIVRRRTPTISDKDLLEFFSLSAPKELKRYGKDFDRAVVTAGYFIPVLSNEIELASDAQPDDTEAKTPEAQPDDDDNDGDFASDIEGDEALMATVTKRTMIQKQKKSETLPAKQVLMPASDGSQEASPAQPLRQSEGTLGKISHMPEPKSNAQDRGNGEVQAAPVETFAQQAASVLPPPSHEDLEMAKSLSVTIPLQQLHEWFKGNSIDGLDVVKSDLRTNAYLRENWDEAREAVFYLTGRPEIKTSDLNRRTAELFTAFMAKTMRDRKDAQSPKLLRPLGWRTTLSNLRTTSGRVQPAPLVKTDHGLDKNNLSTTSENTQHSSAADQKQTLTDNPATSAHTAASSPGAMTLVTPTGQIASEASTPAVKVEPADTQTEKTHLTGNGEIVHSHHAAQESKSPLNSEVSHTLEAAKKTPLQGNREILHRGEAEELTSPPSVSETPHAADAVNQTQQSTSGGTTHLMERTHQSLLSGNGETYTDTPSRTSPLRSVDVRQDGEVRKSVSRQSSPSADALPPRDGEPGTAIAPPEASHPHAGRPQSGEAATATSPPGASPTDAGSLQDSEAGTDTSPPDALPIDAGPPQSGEVRPETPPPYSASGADPLHSGEVTTSAPQQPTPMTETALVQNGEVEDVGHGSTQVMLAPDVPPAPPALPAVGIQDHERGASTSYSTSNPLASTLNEASEDDEGFVEGGESFQVDAGSADDGAMEDVPRSMGRTPALVDTASVPGHRESEGAHAQSSTVTTTNGEMDHPSTQLKSSKATGNGEADTDATSATTASHRADIAQVGEADCGIEALKGVEGEAESTKEEGKSGQGNMFPSA